MEKLMIAAAVAAIGAGAFAGNCDATMDCGFAYRLKLAGKTVVAKSLTKGSVKTCDYESACWAKPASYRVAGYLYGGFTAHDPTSKDATCCDCIDFTAFGDELWFWDANKEEVKFENVAFDVYNVLRNGGLKNKAQIGIKMDDLYLAGFGTFNPEKHLLKSANGFFAGTLAAPQCAGAQNEDCSYGDPTTAFVFAPCAADDGTWSAAAAEKVIAYGRWSLTYKADKVAAIRAGKNIEATLTPANFKAADAVAEDEDND